MKKKTKTRILKITTNGSIQFGWFQKGTSQPPQKSVAISAETTTTLRYSAAKKAAKRPPPYSVLYPPTSSASASARSNGARLVSAKPATMKIRKPTICGKTIQMWSACQATILVSESEPTIITMPTSERPWATSYEISCAAARMEPRKLYFEP